MIIDVPRFRAFVDLHFITNGEKSGYEECYVFAVTLLESRPLLFTIHTVYGAIYSRLPIWALKHSLSNIEAKKNLDPWGAISSHGGVIAHQYLKDYRVETPEGPGIYKFTIDYFKGGFSEDPLQHKNSHIIFLETGLIGAFPNNQLMFLDTHFTDGPSTHYRRNETYFTL